MTPPKPPSSSTSPNAHPYSLATLPSGMSFAQRARDAELRAARAASSSSSTNANSNSNSTSYAMAAAAPGTTGSTSSRPATSTGNATTTSSRTSNAAGGGPTSRIATAANATAAAAAAVATRRMVSGSSLSATNTTYSSPSALTGERDAIAVSIFGDGTRDQGHEHHRHMNNNTGLSGDVRREQHPYHPYSNANSNEDDLVSSSTGDPFVVAEPGPVAVRMPPLPPSSAAAPNPASAGARASAEGSSSMNPVHYGHASAGTSTASSPTVNILMRPPPGLSIPASHLRPLGSDAGDTTSGRSFSRSEKLSRLDELISENRSSASRTVMYDPFAQQQHMHAAAEAELDLDLNLAALAQTDDYILYGHAHPSSRLSSNQLLDMQVRDIPPPTRAALDDEVIAWFTGTAGRGLVYIRETHRYLLKGVRRARSRTFASGGGAESDVRAVDLLAPLVANMHLHALNDPTLNPFIRYADPPAWAVDLSPTRSPSLWGRPRASVTAKNTGDGGGGGGGDYWAWNPPLRVGRDARRPVTRMVDGRVTYLESDH